MFRKCIKINKPRSIFLQCFVLEQRKSKAKHCRNVLGRFLGRKNQIQHRSFNNPYYRSQLFKSNWTKFEQTSYVNSIVLGAVHIATLPTADAILIKLVNLLNTALYSIDPVLQIERNGYRKKLYSLTFLLAIQLFTPIAINSSANFFFRRSGNFSQCTVG